MDKSEIIKHLDELIRKFKTLDKVTQHENKHTLEYLKHQKHATRLGKIEYNSYWAPQKLYILDSDDNRMSIKEYRMNFGDNIELVKGFRPICVLQSSTNKYIEL